MSSFLPMVCPTCGSKLTATEDPRRFACASCGNEYLLDPGGRLEPPGPEEAAPAQRMPPLTAEVRARLAAEVRAAGEQQPADFRQQHPLADWLQQHRRWVSVIALALAVLLTAAVYCLILTH